MKAMISRSHLSNIEAGRKTCPRDRVPDLDRILKASGALIEAWERDEVRRRQLLATGSAFLLGKGTPTAIAACSLNRLALVAQLRAVMISRVACDNAATISDPAAVRDGVRAAHAAYQAADYVGATRMIPKVISDAERVVADSVGRDGRSARALLASANLAGSKLAVKLGEGELGWILADRALTSLGSDRDSALAAVCWAQVANALMRIHKWDEAAESISIAQERFDRTATCDHTVDLAVKGAMLLVAGTVASKQGQWRTADQCLASAEVLASRIGPTQNHLWTAFSPANVLVHRISIAVLHHRSDQATSAWRKLRQENLPTSLASRRTQVHLDLAASYAQQSSGGPPAVLHLLEAERIAPQAVRVNHAAIRTLAELLVRDKRSAVPTPGLHALAERTRVID